MNTEGLSPSARRVVETAERRGYTVEWGLITAEFRKGRRRGWAQFRTSDGGFVRGSLTVPGKFGRNYGRVADLVRDLEA